MTTEPMPPNLPGRDGPGSGTDTIALFASLRPLVSEPSADELADMRHAVLAVLPPRVIGDVDDDAVASTSGGVHPIVTSLVAKPTSGRVRVGLLLATAAAIIVTLAFVRRPDGGATPGGSGTTASLETTSPNTTPGSDATRTTPETAGAVAPTTTAPTATAATVGSTTAGPLLPNERLDPLTAFFAGTENGARVRERTLAGQPSISACMHARGWQYTMQTVRDVYGPANLLQTRDPDEFRRRYGYGVTTSDTRLGYGYGYGDSNQAYLATLTDEQTVAWNLDLSGNGDPAAAPTDRPSCGQVAFDEVNAAGGAGQSVDIGLAGVDPRYDPNKDPRVAAASEAWRACAARAGYDLRFPADTQRFLQRKQDALVRAANEAWDPRSNELPSVAPEQIASLQDEERALAAMDQRCDLEVGLTASRLAADTDIAAGLRERFPEVVVEPYDPTLR